MIKMSKYLEKREGSKQMEGLAQDTNLLSDLSFAAWLWPGSNA